MLGAIHALESQAADIRSSNASTDASSLDGSIQALVYDSILVAEEKLKALERIFQSRHSDFEEAMRFVLFMVLEKLLSIVLTVLW